ncbi:MAG: DUF6089 family protein [Bacteroidota bacterium]
MRTRLSLLFFLLLFFAGFSSLSAQQGLELGVKAGGAVYSGDLSPAEFGFYFEDINFAAGAYLRYRPSDRFGVRINGNFGSISAERDNLFALDEADNLRMISRNFRSTLSEFNLVAEYDLFPFGDYGGNFGAFYVYGGIGVMSFNPEGELNGEFVELQPLRTEGQGLDPTRYAATPYELTRAVGILGAGIRIRFANRFILGAEIGGRYTGTDYLDDVSDVRVNYLDVLDGPGGSQAAQFSNPAVQNIAEVNDLEYVRGGEHLDYYFVGGLTLGITIGEGGSNKSGCYKF